MGNQSYQSWSNEFKVEGERGPDKLIRLRHMVTGENYYGKEVFLVSRQSQADLIDAVRRRQQNPGSKLFPLYRLYHQNDRQYCSNQQNYLITFKRPAMTLLDSLILRRSKMGIYTDDEVGLVIRNVARGLQQLQQIGEDHCNVDLGTIFIHNDVYLQDPITGDWREQQLYGQRQVKGFPSPQKLYNYFDSLTHFQNLTADLYSLGIVALQLIYPSRNIKQIYTNPQSHYENVKINLNHVEALVEGIANPNLRNQVRILTEYRAGERRHIYSLIKQQKINLKNVKLTNEGMLYLEPQIISLQTEHHIQELRAQPNNNIGIVQENPLFKYERNENYGIVNVPLSNGFHLNSKPIQQLSFTNTPALQSINNSFVSATPPTSISFAGKQNTAKVKFGKANLPPSYSNGTNRWNAEPPLLRSLQPSSKISSIQEAGSTNSSLLNDPLTNLFNSAVPNNGYSHGNLYPSFNYNQNQFEPLKSDQSRYQPLKSDQNRYEPYKFQPLKLQPFKYEPYNFEPYKFEPLKLEPYKFQSLKLQPLDPMKLQSLKFDLGDQNYSNVSDAYDSIRQDSNFKQTESLPLEDDKNNLATISVNTNNNEGFHANSNTNDQQQVQLRAFPKIKENGSYIPQIKELPQHQNSNVSQLEFVIEEYDIGTKYEGTKKDGMRNGQGKFFYKEGSYYEGNWKDNRMDGFGILYYPTGSVAYEGEWKDDQFHGRGIVFNDSPRLLQGPFDYTNFNQLDEEWVKYEGDLRRDAKHGHGKLTLTNGEILQGGFQSDRVQGEAIFTRLNGSVVRAIWADSMLKKVL